MWVSIFLADLLSKHGSEISIHRVGQNHKLNIRYAYFGASKN